MKLLGTLFLIAATASFTFGQESKVTSGVVEYTNDDFPKAIEYLKEAVANEGELKEKTIPKAYFYLGSAYLELAKASASKKDFTSKENAINSYNAFDMAIKKGDGKYDKKVSEKFIDLDKVLLLYGFDRISNEKYEEAKTILDCSKSINDRSETPNWMAYDFYGQAALQSNDSTTALTSFEKAITTFTTKSYGLPDASIAYVYLRSAMLYEQLQKNLDKSLQVIKEGLRVLDQEKEKLATAKDVTGEYRSTFLTEWYPAAKADLEKYQLNILLNNPAKLDEALKEFDAAIQKEPKNYQLWMAYAQLMEQKSVDKAADIYLKAIKINPSEFMGHYNLAALYINEGNRMYTMANATHDKNTADQLKKRAAIYYEEGYKQLISCNTIKPSDKTVLQHLVTVSSRLNKTEDHKKYSELLSKL